MMLAAMLLAAGASTRFGAVKQLQPIGATTMLNLAIERVSAIVENRLVVVLGAHHTLIDQSLKKEVHRTIALNWEAGMSASIHSGLSFLQHHYSESMSHVLIALADQIAVDERCLKALMDASQQNPEHIVAAGYEGGVGAPAIFPKAFFNSLSILSGKQGAKTLLNRYSQQVKGIDMPNGKLDIDTQQDLMHWQRISARSLSHRF